MSQQVEIPDVKAVKFERFNVSADGELLIFRVKDTVGNTGHIAVNWLDLANTFHLIKQAAEKAAEVRKGMGKSDLFDSTGPINATLVETFQVSELPDQKVKILTLQSPIGFRADFALRTDTRDQLGRSTPRGIAEELLRDSQTERDRAH